MKNKFLASVIAGAMVVTMLGSVAFAADAVTVNKNVLKPDSYQDVATHTLFAFAAVEQDATIADAIADANSIIAIEQGSEEIPAIQITPAKLEGANYVIVYYGGGTGAATRTEIPVSGTPASVTIDAKDLVGGEYPEVVTELEFTDSETGETKKYTDLIAATYTFSLENINNWGCVGAAFTQTKNGETVTNPLVETSISDLFVGEGNVEITFGFTGVTAAEGTFTALPIYMEYQQQQ